MRASTPRCSTSTPFVVSRCEDRHRSRAEGDQRWAPHDAQGFPAGRSLARGLVEPKEASLQGDRGHDADPGGLCEGRPVVIAPPPAGRVSKSGAGGPRSWAPIRRSRRGRAPERLAELRPMTAPHAAIPQVAVVTAAYNMENYIGATIASVLEQTLPDFEMIVVDDGSRDATAGIVAAVDDPRVRLISIPNNGAGAARNRGLAACRAPLVSLPRCGRSPAPGRPRANGRNDGGEPRSGRLFRPPHQDRRGRGGARQHRAGVPAVAGRGHAPPSAAQEHHRQRRCTLHPHRGGPPRRWLQSQPSLRRGPGVLVPARRAQRFRSDERPGRPEVSAPPLGRQLDASPARRFGPISRLSK